MVSDPTCFVWGYILLPFRTIVALNTEKKFTFIKYWSFNPIPRELKYNLFHARWGIYAPLRDFALAEPKMHQNLC